jgi:site-specific DNA recombinase
MTATPILAAIYARKSTEQTDRPDEEKSVTRQVERAQAYAASKGWIVAPDHIFIDDGVSGAEFQRRPGYLALMNALSVRRPPFEILVLMDQSRLGRSTREVPFALGKIFDHGVRVFTYLNDREIEGTTETDQFMLAAMAYVDGMQREQGRQRTHDALLRKAQNGHVAGGTCYGYRNVDVLAPSGKRAHVIRQIHEPQAEIVRRIFAMIALGKGLVKIAKVLNAEHVPAPRGTSWAPSAVREMLYRTLYRGVITWNKSQKISRGGTKASRIRPESEWLTIDAPELRIVPEDLWVAAHARMDQTRETYARTGFGRMMGKPSRLDLESPYLLSGMGECGVCGGSLIAMTRNHGKRRGKRYGCAWSHERGSTVCTNNLQIPQDVLDRAVLDSLTEILEEHAMVAAIDRALEKVRERQAETEQRATMLDAELLLISMKTSRLVKIITEGSAAAPPLIEALGREEARKQTVVSEIAMLKARQPLALGPAAIDSLKHKLQERAADVRGLLDRHPTLARQAIRKIVVGRLTFVPMVIDGVAVGYRFTGQATFSRLLAGETSASRDGGPKGLPMLP